MFFYGGKDERLLALRIAIWTSSYSDDNVTQDLLLGI